MSVEPGAAGFELAGLVFVGQRLGLLAGCLPAGFLDPSGFHPTSASAPWCEDLDTSLRVSVGYHRRRLAYLLLVVVIALAVGIVGIACTVSYLCVALLSA